MAYPLPRFTRRRVIRDGDFPLPLGAGLMALPAAALALGISELTGRGVTDAPRSAAVIRGVLAAAAFALSSRRASDPVVDLELFRRSTGWLS